MPSRPIYLRRRGVFLVRHPGESRGPESKVLDSGLRRNDRGGKIHRPSIYLGVFIGLVTGTFLWAHPEDKFIQDKKTAENLMEGTSFAGNQAAGPLVIGFSDSEAEETNAEVKAKDKSEQRSENVTPGTPEAAFEESGTWGARVADPVLSRHQLDRRQRDRVLLETAKHYWQEKEQGASSKKTTLHVLMYVLATMGVVTAIIGWGLALTQVAPLFVGLPMFFGGQGLVGAAAGSEAASDAAGNKARAAQSRIEEIDGMLKSNEAEIEKFQQSS